jgi:hypothetical protein
MAILPTDAALPEMRRTLKWRLANGEFKTLSDRLYEAISRLVKQLTGGRVAPAYWVSAFVLILGHLILVCALSSLDGLAVLRQNFVLVVFAGGLAQLGLLLYANQYHVLFATLRDHLVDVMLSPADLADLEQWLAAASSTRYVIAVSLLGGLLPGLYLGSSFVAQQGAGGIGTILATGVQGLVYGMVFYYYIIFVILPMRIGQYNLNLYAIKPSSSEPIVRIANFFSRAVLLLGLYSAMLTLLFAYIGVATVTMAAVICNWVPLIGLFTATQNALSKLIANAKWQTLNGLQATIEKLQSADNFGSKESVETVNRLMDYHDRIEATRSSALNLRTALDFINSLLLPLVAFILANLERILAWLR